MSCGAAPVRRPKEDNVRSSNPLVANWVESLRRVAKARVWVAIMVAATAAVTNGQILPGLGNPVSVDLPNSAPPTKNAETEKELQRAADYLMGRGVAKDPVQAAYWFRKAADHGDPGAQNELGYLYAGGVGVERDNAQAFRWFARSAGGGYEAAKLNMAVMYLKGIGVPRDLGFARDLLVELAAKRNGRAEDYLGLMYLNGFGVAEDSRAAEEWFSRAAKDKNPEGEYAMGQIYSVASGHDHDYAKAAKYLRESARGGYVPAMYTLGTLLVNHPEAGEKGSGEAVGWLTRAAEAGTWQSSATLGTLARDGREIRQDTAEAFRWFVIAAKQGGAEAEEQTRANVARCRLTLAAGEQDAQLRAAQSWVEQHPHTDLFVFNDVRSEFPVGEVYVSGGME